jgi:imidazolonepropionase-like amidohydrolase
VPIPDGAKIIDGTGKFLVPGLIDAHIHFFQSGGLYTRPDIVDLRHVFSYEDEVASIRARLTDTFHRYLAAGVTGVVDMGGPRWNFEVREQAEKLADAPRVAVAGPLISTVSRPQLDLGDPPIIQVTNIKEARSLVKEQLKDSPAFIKVWYILPPSGELSENLPLVKAVIDQSHKGGARVAVHATQLETARAAVKAGADILVHSVDDKLVDEEFVQLLKERNIIYITTLVVYEGYADVFSKDIHLTALEKETGDPVAMASWGELDSPDDADEVARRNGRVARLRGARSIQLENLKRLHAAGITVAAGTDAGNIGTLPGVSMHRELELMAEAGLTPAEIIVAATRNASMVGEAVPRNGTIEAGKLADMLLLDGDPLADIHNLQEIDRIIKGGTVFTPDGLVSPGPAAVVQRQVDAYNARDIDAFAAFYAEDVEIFRLPTGESTLQGRVALHKKYKGFFEKTPELNCQIMKRTVTGNYVVDHEFVTGIAERPRLRAVAIYQVENGLIRRVWFLPKE